MPVYGRLPKRHDPRDLFLADLPPLDTSSAVEVALAAYVKTRSAAAHLMLHKAEVAALPSTPTPPPPPPAGPVAWHHIGDGTLDQGQTPHCVGYAGAGWLANPGVEDPNVLASTAEALYAECKIIDGEPGKQNGTYVKSLMTALLNRKRISLYAQAASAAEVIGWVRTKGPVLVGTDFYYGMETPDSNGFIFPTGGIAGGHGYEIVGVDLDGNPVMQQTWGSWGVTLQDMGFTDTEIGNERSFARMTPDVLDKLIKAQGEAFVAIELPL